jgi:DNA-binding transcriptional regulator LsrR (DeoR family)
MRAMLVQVAHLYYDENLSQQEIADRLEVSRSLIAQYLRRARDTGIVRIQIVDPDDACTDLAVALTKETGIKQVVVLPNPRGSQTLALRAVAKAAAEFIASQLKDGETLGLAWGRTTSLVVDLLKPSPAHRIDVLPLMGESGHSGLYSQMNQLVMLAAEKLRGKAHFLSLPMVVSSSGLRDALVKEAGIRDVIARWDQVHVACMGIGVVPPVLGMVAYVGAEHLPQLVDAGAVGDVCGVYFDAEGRIVKSGLEDRIIGINVPQMKGIGCPMGVACGENKASAVLGAMRTGLLSGLCIDQGMAERILLQVRSVAIRRGSSARRAEMPWLQA